MSAMPSLKYTLPTFLFFSFCGFYFIIFHMVASKAPDRFLEVHKASAVPLNLTNGLLPMLDDMLRPLISFFVSAFADSNSPEYPTVVAFVWSFSSAIQLPLVESLRVEPKSALARPASWFTNVASRALAHPMLWGIAYQRLSGGWIIPLWLIFFLHARTRACGAPVPRAQAESALVGWWLGHTLPALAMLTPNKPSLCVVPIWVAFPILMSLFQRIALLVRARFLRAEINGSGYFPLQLMYASAMVASFVGHVHVVVIPALSAASSYIPTSDVILDKDLGLLDALIAFFLAPLRGPALGTVPTSPVETTAAAGVAHFVQCDVLVVFSAVWVALLWDLALRRRSAPGASQHDTALWTFSMAVSLVLGGLVLSPGAVTGALMMYREACLEKARGEREMVAAAAARLEDASLQPMKEKYQKRAMSL